MGIKKRSSDKLNHSIIFLQLLALVVFGSLYCSTAWSAWGDFGGDFKLNTDGTPYYQQLAECSPSIAVFENNIYTVWADNRRNIDGKADIYFAKGTVDAAGDVAWGQNIRVNDIADSAGDDWTAWPSIAVNQDGDIYVVWADNRNSDDKKSSDDIYLAKSIDGGSSFQANIQVDLFPEDSTQYSDCRAPKVAVAGNYVYVVFGGADRMQIAVSSDKGENFSFAQTIEGGSIDNAVMAASGETVYLAQASSAAQPSDFDDIFFARSTNNGASFSNFEVINDDGGGTRQAEVSIAASGDHVYLLWRDQRDGWSLYMAESHDRGNTFGSNTLITNEVSTPKPSVSAYSDHVAISYTVDRTIVARVSYDPGATWSDEMLVSDPRNPIDIAPSSIAINDQIVGVMWEERARDHSDIYGDGFRFADGVTEPEPAVCPDDGVTLTIEGATRYGLTFPELCIEGVTTPFPFKLILNTNGTWGIEPL